MHSMLKINKEVKTSLLLAWLGTFSHAQAATSLLAGGHAGMVGQYSTGAPPVSATYSGIRVPVGLLLQASPTANLNVFLGVDYAYQNYPQNPVLLGNTQNSTTNNANGTKTPMPFANSLNGGLTPSGQKVDTLALTQAYFAYQTQIGLLRAGRMPRHWGMGLWYDDRWSPTGGAVSTSDAVAFLSDFGLFDVQVFYEKYGESVGGTSNDGDANAIAAEVRLKTDGADAPSSGVTREVGLAFNKFEHKRSDTSLTILDVYTKFYVGQFFLGGEVLYPTGSTKNPNYQTLGGSPACLSPIPDTEPGSQSCALQKFSALAFLGKIKFQLNSTAHSSLFATERAQELLGTVERQNSHVFSLWGGYASGGSNQFASPASLGSDNNISAIAMHPNVQPAFLMFNNTMPQINGMPTGAITNTVFARFDYTYETPHMGSIAPSVTWARLNKTNEEFNAASCPVGSTVVDPTSPTNHMCVGGNSDLGVEMDAAYRYTTLDRVTFGADMGYWFVGNAWQVYGEGSPDSSFGMRVMVSTQF